MVEVNRSMPASDRRADGGDGFARSVVAMSLPLSYVSSSSASPDEFGRGYPRPQLRRDGWRSLNGPWDFAIDAAAAWASPAEVRWDREIRVPFAPEALQSGVGVTSFFRASWYRRVIAVPPLGEGERWL